MNVSIPQVSVAELATALQGGAALIDVREPHEYAEAHVSEAVLVQLATVPAAMDSLPAGRPLYVICRSGGRSASAVEFLRANGVDAINVAGGTLDWVQGGWPTDTATPGGDSVAAAT